MKHIAQLQSYFSLLESVLYLESVFSSLQDCASPNPPHTRTHTMTAAVTVAEVQRLEGELQQCVEHGLGWHSQLSQSTNTKCIKITSGTKQSSLCSFLITHSRTEFEFPELCVVGGDSLLFTPSKLGQIFIF